MYALDTPHPSLLKVPLNVCTGYTTPFPAKVPLNVRTGYTTPFPAEVPLNVCTGYTTLFPAKVPFRSPYYQIRVHKHKNLRN
jgi:hypothetical protein